MKGPLLAAAFAPRWLSGALFPGALVPGMGVPGCATTGGTGASGEWTPPDDCEPLRQSSAGPAPLPLLCSDGTSPLGHLEIQERANCVTTSIRTTPSSQWHYVNACLKTPS